MLGFSGAWLCRRAGGYRKPVPNPLIEQMLEGDRRALGRLISMIENRAEGSGELMAEICRHNRGARVIGITGPPGAGKSTLTDRLVARYRKLGLKVAVIAIDPSSPFTGGAILGDRIRMQSHATDEGVFIRSFGTRGMHGGLSRATHEAVRIFDAAGYGLILIETVGVGQTELDIMELADTTIVVLVPEAGDAIQTMKAGLMEIADVFVVNKADRSGAEKLKLELEQTVHLNEDSTWSAPVLLTTASSGTGIEEVAKAADSHFEKTRNSAQRQQKESSRRLRQLVEIVTDDLRTRLAGDLESGPLRELGQAVSAGTKNPYEAALELLARKNPTGET